MTSIMLYSWALLWADLTKTPSHSALTAACAIVLIVLLPVMSILAEGFDAKRRTFCYVIGLINILVAGLEIYSFAYRDNTTYGIWMFRNGGDFFFGLGVLFVVFMTASFQRLHIFGNLDLLSYEGRFENKWELGFKGLLYGIVVASLVYFFAGESGIFVVGALALFELWVILYPIYSLIKWGGNVLDAIFAIILYVVCLTGLVLLYAHFAIAALIIICIALSGVDKRVGSAVNIELDDGTNLHHVGGDTYKDSYGHEWEDMHNNKFEKRS